MAVTTPDRDDTRRDAGREMPSREREAAPEREQPTPDAEPSRGAPTPEVEPDWSDSPSRRAAPERAPVPGLEPERDAERSPEKAAPLV